MTFIAHISKWNGLNRARKKKRLIIEAIDFSTAYDKVEDDYPDWQINMFWPEYP